LWVSLDCHPERAFFAQRRIWASRALWRAFCATKNARLARFLFKLTHYRIPERLDSLPAGKGPSLLLGMTELNKGSRFGRDYRVSEDKQLPQEAS
jgi:hypothetical protein